MIIDINNFFDLYCSQDYRYGIFIPKDIFNYLDTLTLQGEKFANVRDSIVEEIEANKSELLEVEAKIQTICEHSSTGYKLEKVNIYRAIEEYKEAIRIGETTKAFMYYGGAYDRVIILLHKIKDYKSEQQYISALLKHNLSDSQRQKYENRLIKVIKKNEQTQSI